MTKELLQQCLDLLENGNFVYPTKLREDIERELAQPSDSEYARGFADGQKEFAEVAGGAWQTAVIDQLVIHHIYQAIHDTDPRKAINDLLCISNDIALDPRVSSDAQALIDRGRREAQQEQPASVDAYVGAREDAAIWKKRALEAEELNRKFIAELNGPTYLGEPAQPAQEPFAIVPRTMILEDADLRFLHGLSQPDDEDGSFSPIALTVGDGHAGHGLYASLSEYPEEGADIICKFAPPTQPSPSDDEILNCFYASKSEGMASYMLAVGRAIEAHCRGGASHMNNQEFQERVVEILENLVSSMDQRDFGWVLRQVRNLYEDVREAAKQGGESNGTS